MALQSLLLLSCSCKKNAPPFSGLAFAFSSGRNKVTQRSLSSCLSGETEMKFPNRQHYSAAPESRYIQQGLTPASSQSMPPQASTPNFLSAHFLLCSMPGVSLGCSPAPAPCAVLMLSPWPGVVCLTLPLLAAPVSPIYLGNPFPDTVLRGPRHSAAECPPSM